MTPFLIVVSGAPASGKTTMATELSRRIGMPLFYRDWFKEHLFDSLGIGNRDWSRQLGSASYELLYGAADRLLSRGVSVIIESNFRPRAAEILMQLAAQHQAEIREVFCTADPAVIYERFEARARGDRHPGHIDLVNLESLQKDLASGAFQPLFPTAIVVDTTDFSTINYEELTRKINDDQL